ncbi:MAG TPA: CDP-glucose 4,6-dehydratase, partial [Pseudolabrys sp.]|nr:CDP-glucose 4,6-dehydratase [Pseudolabrys sp.]
CVDPAFWRGKRVLLTGHTGFKGSWMSLWLAAMGSQVSGLALAPDTDPNMFSVVRAGEGIESTICDLRDAKGVCAAVARVQPEIVIHMAAQPLVRRSVVAPSATFATNVTGTVNLLEALRKSERLRVILAVTTDKVYDNNGTRHIFVETDPLGGHDPYSASKAAAEIVVQSFARTYFESAGVTVATARGGNVVGGGDFSDDRIVPDIWRATKKGQPIKLRYPHAIRPWQHVLDCLSGYLCFVQALAERRVTAPALNFGPDLNERITVADLTTSMQVALGAPTGWEYDSDAKPAEMEELQLDCRAARELLGWSSKLPIPRALRATAEWYRAFERNEDMRAVSIRAIEEYQRL